MNVRTIASAMLIAIVGVACQPAAGEEGTQYGEALTLQDTTLISDILAQPDEWVDVRVLVQGTVVEVCEMRGCWVELGSDEEFQSIRVKVEDGVIVFPMSARGLHAVVEGVVERLELTEEEVLERARHHAEEQGEEFDPSTVTGPETIFQLRGIGAVIYE